MPTLNSTGKAGAMPRRSKERATPDNVAERMSQTGTIARIPKALADRALLDAYERTAPAVRFVNGPLAYERWPARERLVGLVSVGGES